MDAVVGIFSRRRDAETALNDLQSVGFNQTKLVLLTPDVSSDQVQRIPTEDGEQPGMGKVIGGVAGGAAGLAGGVLVGSLLVPGVGPVLAMGLGAGALGIGGAVAGGAAGDFLETSLTRGLPKDEIFFYEDALRQGRSMVVALSKDDGLLERGREVMESHGAESLDAARQQWWIGLRDIEEAEYDLPEEPFGAAESTYRRGFEAALEPRCRGKSLGDAHDLLSESYPDLYKKESFRRGYVRGQSYYEQRHRTDL